MRSILVVDDEPVVRRMLVRLLKKAGFRVFSASSGQEAVKILEDLQVDVVATDLEMPGLSGRDVVARLHQRQPEVPFLVMSGGHPELPSDWPFLAKPFRAQELLATIEALIA